MPPKDDFDTAIEAIARLQGKSVDDVKAEMLRSALGSPAPAPPETRTHVLARREMGDASGSDLSRMRSEAVQRHHSQEAPGSPVVRYERDPYGETAEQAAERWLEEEAELVDGVHGLGGSTAGGIFGSGPIATNVYDPEAHARGDARIGQMANVKLLGVLDRLAARLDASEPARGALPPGARRRLGPGKR